ncbi:MAG: hypothetical protein E7266_02590 [Lachnospiraceae bacterium]|nr:hypothetical protein [Lachnospiraceae bacterium]
MKISDRDKKLLYLLGIVIIVFLSFYFGYRNIVNATDELSREYTTENAKYMDLQKKYSKLDSYTADTEKYKLLYDGILAEYPAGCTQEYIIMFLTNAERKTGLWFSQVNLQATENTYNFGKYNSSNPSDTRYKLATDMKGYETRVILTYEGTYEEFKAFIDYIEDFEETYSVDAVSCTYRNESRIVAGSITITQYAIVGEREFGNVSVPTIPVGTDNIFSSSTFSPGNGLYDETDGANIVYDYDMYMILSPETSDVDSVVMGIRYDDNTLLTTNSNKTEEVYIKVTGEAGSYRVQYKLGDKFYPAANYDLGAEYDPGNTLDLLVISSERIDAKDLSGAKVTIVNETDMKLNIKVVNEDEYSPRFTLYSKEGDISVY